MGFEIINKIKKERGLTNAQISSMSGVTLSTLDKITSGVNTNPKLDTLQAICRVLGCTLNDFMETPIQKEKAPSLSDEAIIEQITERYGGAAGEALSMYVRLDDSDRGEIRGEMRQMLKAEKYTHSEPRMA